MVRTSSRWFWVVFFLVYLTPLKANETNRPVFKSGPNRVHLVELFTSEGCSSCPVADRWLASLRHNPGLWQTFVPLSFHVDYWDNLGWKDKLATKAFTQRQRNHARLWGNSNIYTPGFVLDGKEWRKWHSQRTRPFKKLGKKVGVLSAVKKDKNRFSLSFKPEEPLKDLIINTAILTNQIKSKILRGENAGKTLTHEFTVTHHQMQSLKYMQDLWQAEILLPDKKLAGAAPKSIAFWVSQKGYLKPIQAVGGDWLEAK